MSGYVSAAGLAHLRVMQAREAAPAAPAELMLSRVFAQQPGASCIALQAVARIQTRRSIAVAARVAASEDAALSLWVKKQVRHCKRLVGESAQLAAGCFGGEGSSQQQQQSSAANAAEPASPAAAAPAAAAAAATTQTVMRAAGEHSAAAFGLLITSFKAQNYAVQQNEDSCTHGACHVSCAVLQCICQVPNPAAANELLDAGSSSSTPVHNSNIEDVTAAAAAASSALAGSTTSVASSYIAGADVSTCSSSTAAAAAAVGELGVMQLLLVSHSLLLLAKAMEAALSAEQPEEAERLFFQAVLWIGAEIVV
jgi:hypothetical protein